MKREDKFNVRLTVAGRDLGTWDKKDGGEVDSDDTTYRPGGTEDQISLGGPVKTGNLTLNRLYDEGAHSVYHWLVALVGKADAVVAQQPLDADDNAFGRPIVYSAKLKRVQAPSYDSNGNGAATLEVELTVNGRPS